MCLNSILFSGLEYRQWHALILVLESSRQLRLYFTCIDKSYIEGKCPFLEIRMLVEQQGRFIDNRLVFLKVNKYRARKD